MTAIQDHYAWLGGTRSFLGNLVGGESSTGVDDGRVQRYEFGRIYSQEDIGTYEVHGDILAVYRAKNGPAGLLGYPVTDELRCHDQLGRISRFKGGVIIWHPVLGAFEVHGAILDKWLTLGAERSELGYPTSDELDLQDGGGKSIGKFSSFERGVICWSMATGAHELHGDIWRRWRDLGGAASPQGLPTADETPTADGVGRISTFVTGSISWTPAGGAVVTP